MSKNLHNEFERLAHQDPATGMQFDEAAVLENLAGRLPQGTMAQVFPNEGQDSAPSTENSADVVPIRRRGLAWTQIAASAAVTALAVGGATVVLNDDDAGQSVASIDSSNFGHPGAERLEGPSATGMANLPMTANPESSVSNTSMFFGSGRSIFSANGLSDQQATSNVFGFDSTAAVTKESFESLKDVFGVTAKTSNSWGSFYAGGQDGVGPSLSLQGGADGAFSYSLNSPVPDSKSISEEEAVSKAQAIMAELGLEADDFTYQASESEYYQWVGSQDDPGDGATIEPFIEEPEDSGSPETAMGSAEVSPEAPDSSVSSRSLSVDGETTASRIVSATLTQFGPEVWSVQWQFEYVGETLVSANGMLADVVDLGEYEVISPAQGLDRLNSSAFGALNVYYPEGGSGIMPAVPDNAQTYSEDSEPTGVAAPQAGSAVPWQVSKVDLKEPRLAYASLYSGEYLQVVPVWRYTSTEGIDYEVLALTDAELALQN